ncbi:MAG TPA: protein kinase [Gemmataceae bacterium]|nr:protein kinase [Gemmataceae bacterium]
MNPTQLTHPTAKQLEAFGLGRLGEAEALALESHLAVCSECSRALEELPADNFVARLRGAMEVEPSTRVEAGELAEAVTLTGSPGSSTMSNAVPAELANHPRYRIFQELGAGGMGVVYKAEHLLMERPVALKVIGQRLIGDASAVERFRREVRSAAQLCHPNIVTANDAEQAGDTHFLVMEFVEGTSLDRLVAEQGPLPVIQACDYARQAALGLQHAFERGMVHRDIKPQNLMLTPAPGTRPWGLIKILDFGLARFAKENIPAGSAPTGSEPAGQQRGLAERRALTSTGALMGTLDYMAPEQIRDPHAADIRADIYSLGCTLYFLLTGRVVFPEATEVEKLLAHEEKTPRPLAELRGDVPPGLVRVFERMTARAPAQRYQTPAEVARALEPFTTAEGATYLPPQPAVAAQPPRWRRRVRTLVASGFIGGLFLIFLVLALSEDQQKVNAHMETIYTICALLGGTLLGVQFLMSLLGLGHHDGVGSDFHDVAGHDVHAGGEAHDVSHDAQVSWFAGILTFRTVVAALTFFGLAGRASAAAETTPAGSLVIALAAGGAALFGVAFLMRSLYRLRAEGTARIDRALGHTATVYLSVPGHKSGAGKVHLNLQNRTVECQAVTAQEPLPCGTKVVVVGLAGPDTVEVVLAPSSERITHV